MLTPILKGSHHSGLKQTAVDGNVIIMNAVSQSEMLDSKEYRGYYHQVKFDFSAVPLPVVYQAAAEYALIAWRRKYVKSDNPEYTYNDTYPARKFLPKDKLSHKDQLHSAAETLCDADKLELIQKLQSDLGISS